MAFSLPSLLFYLASAALTAASLQTGQVQKLAPSTQTAQVQSDTALALTRSLDRASRASDGSLPQMSAAEHLRRAHVYMSNRAFVEAREHFKNLVDRYPSDTAVPAALYGLGRSHFQIREYRESIPFFERVASEFKDTREGRDSLYSLASAFLRLGEADQAAERYRQYTELYSTGERIDGAYLNVIDTLREAGHPEEAIEWVGRTRQRFSGTYVEANALFAKLRLDVAARDWNQAVLTADELRRMNLSNGTMTNSEEISYLRAYSLEQLGRRDDAISTYLGITDSADSYHGTLASLRLMSLVDAGKRLTATTRVERAKRQTLGSAIQYPAPYRDVILRETRKRSVDPRLVLAVMRQESSFRPRAKSPAAARGLMQITMDAARKYAARAGYPNLTEDDLYKPEVSIAIAAEYLGELNQMFPGLPEAAIASYNGGEDNVARWLKRSGHSDGAIFTSEVGFSETKGYVLKVMANYTAYKELYTAALTRR